MLSSTRNHLLRCILLYRYGEGGNVLVLLNCSRVLVISPYSIKEWKQGGKEGGHTGRDGMGWDELTSLALDNVRGSTVYNTWNTL
jgi:hypothetical protein